MMPTTLELLTEYFLICVLFLNIWVGIWLMIGGVESVCKRNSWVKIRGGENNE